VSEQARRGLLFFYSQTGAIFMATDRQIAANRANAQKSTGPRTQAGKAASSANALKSGVYAQSTLIPGDDPAEYEALRQEHFDHFAPANPDERDLLDLMIKYKWQLRRLHNCYDQMWLRELDKDLKSEYYNPNAPLVRPFNLANVNCNSLINLSRMIHSTDRAFHRTRAALIKAQDQRRRAESKSIATATPAPKLASFPEKTPAPQPAPRPAAALPIPSLPGPQILKTLQTEDNPLLK
jgi:hypothetical protein